MQAMAFQRKTSPRLKGFDYHLASYYFITICTADRLSRFGSITDGQIVLNDSGAIVEDAWRDLPSHYLNLDLDAFIVMPNHFHAIAILDKDGADRFGNLSLRKGHDLSEIVRGFKTWSARRVNEHEGNTGIPLWQRSFYDHIIRDDKDLESIREYIVNNPFKWELDKENPKNF